MHRPLPDTELVIRRFDPANENSIKQIESPQVLLDVGINKIRMSSGAFIWAYEADLPDRLCCSVYCDGVLAANGHSRRVVLEDSSWLIAAASASAVRSIGNHRNQSHKPIDALEDPLDQMNPDRHARDDAHALLTVPDDLPSKVKTRLFTNLARAFEIIPFDRE